MRVKTCWTYHSTKNNLGGVLMIYIGIDISKYKHDCFFATETNHVAFSFENNQLGFNEFITHIKPLSKEKMIIGLEATGHYCDNLKSFLLAHGYKFMELNPFLVKKFSDSKSLRKLKTDKKDAKLISEYMRTVDFKAYHNQSYHIQRLKSLTRYRSKLVSTRTRFYNMITKSLDIVFPEYKPFKDEQGYSELTLYLFSKYTSTNKIKSLNEKHYDSLRRLSMGKFSYPKFIKLKELARNSIGSNNETHISMIKDNIKFIKSLNSQIEKTEKEIEIIMQNYPTNFQVIKGIGINSAATIIAEYGDISRFRTAAQMTSFSGLDSRISESGTMASTGKLVKRGSKYLRATLINVCQTLYIHNRVFYDYYIKKKNEGKHHRVAMVHLAKKLIRIIFHLEKNNIPYDQSLLK